MLIYVGVLYLDLIDVRYIKYICFATLEYGVFNDPVLFICLYGVLRNFNILFNYIMA